MAMRSNSASQLLSLLKVSSERQGESFEWSSVEASIGLRLPDDYKRIVDSIPDGWIRDFVRLARPGLFRYPVSQYLGWFEYALEDLRGWREQRPADFPYPIFPEPGGLLPWGLGPRRALFFWLTGPDAPENWPIVLADWDCRNWATLDFTLSEFLVEVATGRFDATMFQMDLSSAKLLFKDLTPSVLPSFVAPDPQFWSKLRKGHPGPTQEMEELSALIGSVRPAVAQVNWSEVERRLGVNLPRDYKAFIDTYGPGECSEILVSAPDGPDGFNLFQLLRNEYEKTLDRPGPSNGAPVYPETQGLIAWGQTRDGWTCYWAPSGPDPDDWGIVTTKPRGLVRGGYSYHSDISFSSLLRGYADPDWTAWIMITREPKYGSPIFIPAGNDGRRPN